MPERMTDNKEGLLGKRIFLLSCAKTKKPFRAKARDLYDSVLFRKMCRYAQHQNPDTILVLSAKHGVLGLDDVIDPYDQTLNTMSSAEIAAWAQGVLVQLRERTDIERDHFTVLASKNYRRYLLPHLRHHYVPMEGLSIGRQLRFLTMESKS